MKGEKIGKFFLKIKENFGAFLNKLFWNFYFYPVLWLDRVKKSVFRETYPFLFFY